jgi:hypothetical protein
MKHFYQLYCFALSMLQAQSVAPSKNIILDFNLKANGQPTYTVNYKNKAVVLESAMGIKLKAYSRR